MEKDTYDKKIFIKVRTPAPLSSPFHVLWKGRPSLTSLLYNLHTLQANKSSFTTSYIELKKLVYTPNTLEVYKYEITNHSFCNAFLEPRSQLLFKPNTLSQGVNNLHTLEAKPASIPVLETKSFLPLSLEVTLNSSYHTEAKKLIPYQAHSLEPRSQPALTAWQQVNKHLFNLYSGLDVFCTLPTP